MSNAPNTEDMVRKVGKLARLALSEEDVTRYSKDMGKILAMVDQLSELQLDENFGHSNYVPEANAPTVYRDDVVKPSIDMELKLMNAPDAEEQAFKVPKILDN